MGRVDRVGDLQDTTSRLLEGGPPVCYFGMQASRSGLGLSEERSILSMPCMLPDKRGGRAAGNSRWDSAAKNHCAPMVELLQVRHC